ncbi:MAG: DUF1232 domain-containing protein [Bacteroidales bacterium]|nr:DUF1232 domain-containing protein [Bacteroidales bacterium]MDE6147888.1 DUF1232 domain-containing protein [Bacteroidales bacterium]
MKHPKEIERYGEHYSDRKFSKKLLKAARKAGAQTVYAVMLLYYVLRSPSVSNADKAKVYGALGYFILPLDLLPDFLPLIGYADDLSAAIWALHTVWKNITPEIRSRAAAKTREWFSGFDQSSADAQFAE